MPNIVVLNSQVHSKLRVHAEPSEMLGDNQRLVPVVIGEFPLLCMHYPLAFSKDADTGQFYCGALMGFETGENLFAQDQRERQLYRPLNLQRGPFYTAGADLAIDLDHARVSPSGGQALFGDDGTATPYLASIMTLMRDLRPGQERTKVFIDTLLALQLIESVTLDVRFDDGTRREASGLYTVNRDELAGLTDAAALDLFRRGYLQLIYLMRASLSHVTTMVQMKNRRFLPEAAAGSGTR